MTLSLSVDVAKNDGGFSLSVFGIKAVSDKIFFKHLSKSENDVVLESKGKVKYFHLNADKNDERSVARVLNVDYVPPISIKKLELNLVVGKRDDAMATTAAVSALRVITTAVAAWITVKYAAKVRASVLPKYTADEIKLNAVVNAEITVCDAIVTLIKYIRKKIKEATRKYDHTARRTSY